MSKKCNVWSIISPNYLIKEVITFQGGVIHLRSPEKRVYKYAEMMFLDLLSKDV